MAKNSTVDKYVDKKLVVSGALAAAFAVVVVTPLMHKAWAAIRTKFNI